MKCSRCCGLMVEDHLLDMQESYIPMWMRALRCLACGNIVDPVIHYHRTVRHTQRVSRVAPRLVRPVARRAEAA